MKTLVSRLSVGAQIVGYGKITNIRYHRTYKDCMKGRVRSERGITVSFDEGERIVTWANSIEVDEEVVS